MKEIEAIGPTNQGNVWTITFQTVAARQLVVAVAHFFIRSCRAVVAGSP